MESTAAEVWKLAPVVDQFLGIRAGIPFAQEQIGIMLVILAARGEPINRFLDLGCGNGILAAAILGKYPTSRGTLIDFSEPMLAQAREGLRDFSSQLRFVEADYADPVWMEPFLKEPAFDSIVSGYSIHHQSDEHKRAIYAEIHELLRPGGWFVNVEHVAPAAQLATDLFEKSILDAKIAEELRLGGSKTRQQITEAFNNRADKAANRLTSVEIQCDWLRDIGYEDVDCYFRVYSLAVFAGHRSY
jgi:SAM-dependent methyltransferase